MKAEQILHIHEIPVDSGKVSSFKNLVREARQRVREGEKDREYKQIVYLQRGTTFIKIMDTDMRKGMGGLLYIDIVNLDERSLGISPTIILPREVRDVTQGNLGSLQRFDTEYVAGLMSKMETSAVTSAEVYRNQVDLAKKLIASRNRI